MGLSDPTIEKLIGRTIKKIYMNEENLKFETDEGNIVFGVEGDCCSHSYFYDFLGVKKLLAGNPVVSVKSIDLGTYELDWEEVACYGYEIVTNDPKFGEVTSVFSFRNASNGYYGGWMEDASDDTVVDPEIKNDVLEAVSKKEQ